MFVLFLLIGLPLADLLWWRWADRRLKKISKPRFWRSLLAVFSGFQIAGFLWIVASRWLHVPMRIGGPPLILVYLWHLIVLPTASVLTLISCGIDALIRWAGKPDPSEETSSPSPQEKPSAGLTRRQILGAAAAAAPPALLAGLTGYAQAQLGDFRVRRFAIDLPVLPPALDGLKIAHLSDTHIGRFTRSKQLDQIIQRTNAMNADLVLMTGDLIDYHIDDLPTGIDLMKQLRSRYGTYLCEGNHDLFQNRKAFEQGVKTAGLRLLVNETESFHIRGQAVQLLGLRWGGEKDNSVRGAQYWYNARPLLAQRQPGAFQILLAHHPHAFEAAADRNIPLTLAGHTHGGQIMLTENIGPGPWMYRWWSGLYRDGDNALVVSNGTGNWFPLRVNAPAEIVEITLRRPKV